MFIPNREELAWAAGFFDGEGYVGLVPSKVRPTIVQIAITQVDRRVLDRFTAAVGIGKVYGPTRQRGNTRPQYRYHTSHHPRVQAICALLWPWLSPVKRAQFHHALATPSKPTSTNYPLCQHEKHPSKCRECLRAPNREKMRRFRLRQKELAT